MRIAIDFIEGFIVAILFVTCSFGFQYYVVGKPYSIRIFMRDLILTAMYEYFIFNRVCKNTSLRTNLIDCCILTGLLFGLQYTLGS